MMHKGFLKTAFLLAATAVALGAFAAHGLKKIAGPDVIATFETAVRYQFYHVFALLAAGVLYKDYPWFKIAGWMFITGILLFSGSLYLLCAAKIGGSADFNWLGMITPFGGLCLVAGWVWMLVMTIKNDPDRV